MNIAISIIAASSVVSTILLYMIKMALDYIIYFSCLGDEEK